MPAPMTATRKFLPGATASFVQSGASESAGSPSSKAGMGRYRSSVRQVLSERGHS